MPPASPAKAIAPKPSNATVLTVANPELAVGEVTDVMLDVGLLEACEIAVEVAAR